MKKLLFFLSFIFIIVTTVNTYASEENEGVVSLKIYSYDVVQDSDGNLKYTFYKSENTLYDENTIFDIEELGVYNITSDKSITIPFTLLNDQERVLDIRVKEDGKEYSEYSEIYVFPYQTDYHASNLTNIFIYYQKRLKEIESLSYVNNIEEYKAELGGYLSLFLYEINNVDDVFEIIGIKAKYQKEMNNTVERLELLNENNYQIESLNAYILDVTSAVDDELQVIIDKAKLEISNNTNINNAIELFNQALLNIDNYLTTKVNLVKEQLNDEFTTYIGINLNADTLLIINKNLTSVNSKNYNIFEEVERIRETIKLELDRYLLEILIEETILEISEYVNDITSIIDLELYNIITLNNQLLYDAISNDHLKELKTNALNDIDNYLTNQVMLKQDEFMELITSTEIIDDKNILDIIENNKNKITSKNYNIEGILDDLLIITNEEIYQYYLTVYKNETINDLNEYIDINFYKYKVIESIFIEQLIKLINESKSEDNVDEAYLDAINQIEVKLNQYYTLKVTEVKNELIEYTSFYEVNLTKLIDEELKKIDKLNHMDDSFINQFLIDTKLLIDQNVIHALKEKYILELENKVNSVSELFDLEKESLIDEINELINKQTTIEDVHQIYETLSLKVLRLLDKENIINKFIVDYEIYKNKDKYTTTNLSALESIYLKQFETLVTLTNELLEEKIKEIFYELDKIPILEIKNSTYTLYDKVNNPNYQSVIQNDLGLYKYSKLSLEIINIKNHEKTLSYLLKKNGYRDYAILSGVSIYIENQNEINGIYKVGLAIPNEIKQNKELHVVYYDDQHFQVLDVKLIDDWLVFDTTHFSNYFIVSLHKGNKVLGIIIYILSFILLFEVAYLFYKRNQDILYKVNSFNLLFFVISSSLGIPIIVMLSILVVIFLALIIYEHSETKYKVVIKKEIVQNDIYIDTFEEKEGAIYNYSFLARLIQAPIESQKRYSDLKNYILRYPHVKILKSFKYERYMYKNKPVIKLWIHGNNLKVYYNLPIERIDKEKYLIEDLSHVKKHETTPILYFVKGPRNLKYAYELIDLYFEFLEVKENRPYKDYTKKYLDKKTLIARDLIRVKYGAIKNKE